MKKIVIVVSFIVILLTAFYFVSLPNIVITITDDLFKAPDILKHAKIDLPAGSWKKIELVFEADSKGDEIDRLYSVYLNLPNGIIELHRGITPFGGSIKSIEDVTRYAVFLKGTQTISTLLTAAKEGGWAAEVRMQFYRAYILPPDPADRILPVFGLERFPSGDSQSREAEFPARVRKAILTLFATGHGWNIGGEEYKLKKVIVRLDGEVIANTKLIGWWYGLRGRGGWDPGQGRVPPYEFDVTDKIKPGVHNITVEIPDFEFKEEQPENTWIISLHFSLWTTSNYNKVGLIGALVQAEFLTAAITPGFIKIFKKYKRW